MFLQNIDLTLKLYQRWYFCAPTFSESNALDFCLMTGILENVLSPFQSVPPIIYFLKTCYNVVENDGRFLDDF